ncbi:NADP-dependent oxidoreductase [Arthrobacter russicus]|jgi:NADPH:quinone reductase-like Zn-dependent oxidoreductase|uniref:NADPH:quinone reductase-like Zn-dependent oxidoreductase n=1 Tax=Arthrobacter russicus TaxID=172040 RepID=A0ABU1JFZ7_9MICC|nr:NADP-dependent oxidoreductase [Arthrobacter russicus]MDR6271049.1 NADPH:quinone reductase-like Zn-dependent oxidoreductase [Arthrobacter russicus]
MSRFVQYEEFGGPEVLQIVNVADPEPGPGEIRIKVAAAGLNPVDFKIFHGGPIAEAFGASLPSGVGNDFAGVVDRVGAGVSEFAVGDEVFGAARNHAIADLVVVPVESVLPLPAGLSLETAATLWVAGRTAWALVESLELTGQDTVVVSAAAGGVGVLAAQLAKRKGATVIGTASAANHEYLRSIGVLPVAYGEGLADRLRAAAPQGLTAMVDAQGAASISAALAVGVPTARIVSAAAHAPDELQGARAVGGNDATTEELAVVAQLVADGALEVPIDSRFPLDQVQQAYVRAEGGHLRGKIVVSLA